jgi:small subunit ribosomal protein S7
MLPALARCLRAAGPAAEAAATQTAWRTPHSWQQVAFARNSLQDRSAGKKGKKGAQGDGSSSGSGAAAAAAESMQYHEEEVAADKDATRIVLTAIENVVPKLDVRTTKSSTKVTFVPGLMPPNKGRSLALRWLAQAAHNRKKSSKGRFADCLAMELLLAYQKKGAARQKRDDLHKLALQNRANLHLRWW